jgi:hypothetical protein
MYLALDDTMAIFIAMNETGRHYPGARQTAAATGA